jgi:hypothetical protein
MAYLITKGSHYAILHYFRRRKCIVPTGAQFIPFLPPDTEVIEKRDLNIHQLKDEVFTLDSSEDYEFLRGLKARGFKTFNGELCELEDDRVATMLVFEKAKIPIPRWEYAETFEELIRKVENFRGEKIVVKGDKKIPSWGTLSGERDKILETLQKNEEIWGEEKNWIIQEFVEGYEISCEVYISRGVPFITLTNFTIETKNLYAGNLGVRTGGETNLIIPWYGTAFQEKLLETTLRLMSVVPVQNTIYDINYICKGERLYALEITPRIGYPGTITFAHILYNNDLYYDDVIEGLFDGKECDVNGFGFGIKLTLPPYPFLEYSTVSKLKDKLEQDKELKDKIDAIPFLKGIKVLEEGVGEERRDVKVAWDGIYFSEQNFGKIGSCESGILNAFSIDPAEAIEMAYREAEEYKSCIPLLQYRILDEHMQERINYFLEVMFK